MVVNFVGGFFGVLIFCVEDGGSVIGFGCGGVVLFFIFFGFDLLFVLLFVL